MGRYIQGKDGKFAGSIGEGKSRIPTAQMTPARASTDTPTDAVDYEQFYGAFAHRSDDWRESADNYLAERQQRLQESEQMVREATQRLEEAHALVSEPIDALEEENKAREARAEKLEILGLEGRDALEDCRPHLFRLYCAAGVPDTIAGRLTEQVLRKAARGRAEDPSRWRGSWARPIATPWMIESSEYAEQTAAAVAAGKTDPEYLKARRKVGAILDQIDEVHRSSVTRDAQAHSLSRERWRDYRRALHARDQALEAREDAKKEVADAYVRKQAGIPGNAVRTRLDRQSLANVPEISRNPDGSTNAWVWYPPDDESSMGSYVPVVGVVAQRGTMQAANSLETADGKHHSRVEHYFRGPGRGFNSEPIVVVAPPQQGAVPLDHEGIAGKGYSVFIDSTD